MKIYVPVTEFEHGAVKHGIAELDSDRCRILGGCIEHCGTIYGERAYTIPEAVLLYWSKEDWRAEQFRYQF